jgi:hypothetical protein
MSNQHSGTLKSEIEIKINIISLTIKKINEELIIYSDDPTQVRHARKRLKYEEENLKMLQSEYPEYFV